MDVKYFLIMVPLPFQPGIKYIYSLIPPRFRYNKVFWETYAFLQQSQWWSKDKLKQYQIQQLSKLLRHAYENVPYYRGVFDERGLKPEMVRDISDLRKLPFLTKEIIRKNPLDFMAGNYSKSKLRYTTTGGSTGTPLGFYQDGRMSDAKELAFTVTLLNRAGFRIGDKSVILRGNVVESAKDGKFWEYDPINRNLILSSYHMNEENLVLYVDKIREFKPDFIQGYPSAITILARFMKENGVEHFPGVRAILCSSEKLYPGQRLLLEEVLRCRAWSFYGHTEQAVLSGECEKSSYYHLQPEYGITELIDKEEEPVPKDGGRGEVIATGFINYAFPFIRYRTGDIAVRSNVECGCGRNYPLLKKIEGRVQEFIIARDGSSIPLGPVIFGIHEPEWTMIKQIQFLQEEPGDITIRIIKSLTSTKKEIERFVQRLFKARLEGRCNIKVEFVDHIPLTKRGKHRLLIQKLPVSLEGREIE